MKKVVLHNGVGMPALEFGIYQVEAGKTEHVVLAIFFELRNP